MMHADSTLSIAFFLSIAVEVEPATCCDIGFPFITQFFANRDVFPCLRSIDQKYDVIMETLAWAIFKFPCITMQRLFGSDMFDELLSMRNDLIEQSKMLLFISA